MTRDQKHDRDHALKMALADLKAVATRLGIASLGREQITIAVEEINRAADRIRLVRAIDAADQ